MQIKLAKEYFFTITIEGVDGQLKYSVIAESRQEAFDMVNYFVNGQPLITELDKEKELV